MTVPQRLQAQEAQESTKEIKEALVEPEIPVEVGEYVETTAEELPIILSELDFQAIRMPTSTFCMRCGGEGRYIGRSIKQNFKKRLCANCVQYYEQTLNAPGS